MSKEFKSVNYDCEVLKGTAHLELQYAIHSSGARALVKFDCNDCYKCGVAIEKRASGNIRSYNFDWSKCPVQEKLRKTS